VYVKEVLAPICNRSPRLGYHWIFYLVSHFALASAAAAALIRPQEVDHVVARGGNDQDLPTETLKKKEARPIPTVGWTMRRGIGRKTIFLVAFVTLPIRGLLFTLTDSPVGVVAIQLLDGVAAGIFGVISIIIAADLMRGTGRFNLAQGLVALSTGLGATASNVCAGFVVQVFGYTTGFLTLAAIAVGGLVLFCIVYARNETAGRTSRYFRTR
jgi:MFS family permease